MPAKSKNRSTNLLSKLSFSRRTLIIILVFLVAGGFLIFMSRAATTGFNSTEETNEYNSINNERSSRGIAKLNRSSCLAHVAEGWAAKMAAAGTISHNPNLVSQVEANCGTGWSALGENVGEGPSRSSIFSAYMASSGHKANILDTDYNYLGTAIYTASDGTVYSVDDFGGCSSGCSNWGWVGTSSGDIVPTNIQLLSNAGFEGNVGSQSWSSIRNLNYWYVSTTGSAVASRGTSSVAHGGSYVASLHDTSDGSAAAAQVVKATSGGSYTLTAWNLWWADHGSAPQQMYLDFLNSSFSRITYYTVNTPVGNHTWSQVSLTKTAPSGTAYIRVILYGGTGSTASLYYWDDVRLVKN